MKGEIVVLCGVVRNAAFKWKYGLARYDALTVETRDGIVTLQKVFAGVELARALPEGARCALGVLRSERTQYVVALRVGERTTIDHSAVNWGRTTDSGRSVTFWGPSDLGGAIFMILLAPVYFAFYQRFRPLKDLSKQTDWARLLADRAW